MPWDHRHVFWLCGGVHRSDRTHTGALLCVLGQQGRRAIKRKGTHEARHTTNSVEVIRLKARPWNIPALSSATRCAKVGPQHPSSLRVLRRRPLRARPGNCRVHRARGRCIKRPVRYRPHFLMPFTSFSDHKQLPKNRREATWPKDKNVHNRQEYITYVPACTHR